MRRTGRGAAAGAALTAALVAGLAAAGLGVTRPPGDAPAPPAVAPPAAAPAVERGPLLPPPDVGLPLTAAGVAAALAPALADPALGPGANAAVVDVATGAPLLDLRGDEPVVPASTAKVLTAVAVLTGLPSQTRLTTRVLAGAAPGEVVLVGGGDVTLAGPQAPAAVPAPARLTDLAAQTRRALAPDATAPAAAPPAAASPGAAPPGAAPPGAAPPGAAPPGSSPAAAVTRVLVDDSAWTGPALGPSWRPGYVTGGAVAPVSALAVDAGRVAPGRLERVPDPALAAGRAFAQLLGVPTGAVARGPAPPGAAVLAAVDSPPVGQLVEQMLSRSDNDLAEALAHRLAQEQGRPASFAGGAQAVAAQLDGLLAPGEAALVDGSGLSRDSRLRPAALARLLASVARDGGPLAPVLSGLPVAGFDGTLERRYRSGPELPAAGRVRAKTGTLEGVSALAGLVRTADGRLLAFDVTADQVPGGGTRAAEAALDRVAAGLAACGCR